MYTFSAETNTKCSSKSVVQSIQSCWCPEIIVQPSLKISRVLDKFRQNGLNRLILDINWVSRQDMGNILITSLYSVSYSIQCSVPNSSDGLIFVKRRALDGPFLDKNTGFRRALDGL